MVPVSVSAAASLIFFLAILSELCYTILKQ